MIAPPLPQPLTTVILLCVSMNLTIPGTSCQWNPTAFVFLCLVCFTYFTISPAVHKIPVSPHLLQHLLFSGILIATIPMGMMCYLIEVLICILLMISDVEYLFMCLLAIRISSLEKYLFQSFAYVFNWVVYFFGC